jgi:hypothetical protein
MLRKCSVMLAMFACMSFSPMSMAETQCKADGDCKSGEYCIVALSPPVCKAPQAAGAACKRDVVCASGKCDIPSGQEKGTCK